jgi:hypothetical protein
LGIDQFTLTLSTSAPLAAGDVSVTGAIGGNYGPVTVTGSGTTFTITLAKPIEQADRVTVSIGNLAVAAFSGQLAVLPGDVNDDGVVDGNDVNVVLNQLLGVITATMFGDIDGSGTVDESDYQDVIGRLGTTLP